METDKLRNFLNKIAGIQAPMINLFGSGMPGIGGGAAITEGAITPGNDIVMQMRRQAAQFASVYSKHTDNKDDLKKYAQPIEGSILTLQTISIITADEADSLIDELYTLCE